jgi:segregation and condensation protein B
MTASNALADIIERLKRREQTMGLHEARPPPLRSVPEPGHLVRTVEALLFAAAEPLSAKDLAAALPEGSDVSAVLGELQRDYASRGVNLVQVAGKWAFRTAEDLSHLMRRETVEARRLSRAALETLAIIAYHQPVTRAEVEDIRGVAMSRGTLDQLLEIGWVRMRGRRRSPGRPVTYGTTNSCGSLRVPGFSMRTSRRTSIFRCRRLCPSLPPTRIRSRTRRPKRHWKRMRSSRPRRMCRRSPGAFEIEPGKAYLLMIRSRNPEARVGCGSDAFLS